MAIVQRRGPKLAQDSTASSKLHRRKYNAGYVADLERRAEQLERALKEWERATADAEKACYVFPDNDLITSLVAIYFETMNPILPILHRPTFVKNVADGLHLRDENFAATLLFVLAVASRHSDDPRVLADPSSRLSAGWTFLEFIPIAKKVLLRPPCLNDIQQTVLSVMYTFGSSVPEFTWMVVGLGLRALVTLDRLLSLYEGRPIMMQEEDFDVELPVECDDEYWDIRLDGEVRFCQPGNRPSKISYFNAQIQLSGIMSVVVRNLYSIKKGQDKLGLPKKDGDRIISDIDSSMNAWMNSIPAHLRWDPDRDNKLFLYQSAVLYSTYHMLQIYTHRPFLRPGSSLSTPSLVISTMAARSCARILQVHLTRLKIITPHLLIVAFMSGTVLAMNIWSGKRVGHPSHADDLVGYEQCLATFIHASDTWMIAGRSLKIFKGMASFETTSALDSTSITHPQDSTAPIWSSYGAIPDTPYEQVQPSGIRGLPSVDATYLNDYLPTYLRTDLPLDQTNENSSSSFQSLIFNIGQSEMSSGPDTINMWTFAPPGFNFAAWDTYVTNMSLEDEHSQ
ncbi:hypothetical protein EDD18DRAFT_1363992 [Armillaria luteobubalina]|uniref:Xylanolytic transcriptional activator regulatory domain-containing protein n=1 Tax=Armillaria luteobubalina TaxID=153913 RepID=A0AA39P9R5_9AGAR|nr:hypothetical protein EDD18DRAFT_1363992 [Armillaria luteobubalina]